MNILEKTPLNSKKFIAFFFALLIIAGILTIALITQTFSWSMSLFMAIGMLGIAFVAIGYVLSQAALDKFVSSLGNLKDTISNVSKEKESNEESDKDME